MLSETGCADGAHEPERATVIPAPWNDQPHTPIPDPLNALRLRLLTLDELETVLHSNLVPQGGNKAQFFALWILLSFNNDLAERAFDILEAWLDQIDALPADDPQQEQAKRFKGRCEDAWNRLTRFRDCDTRERIPDPGTTAARFALAIGAHRQAIGETAGTAWDQALWAAPTQTLDRGRKRGATNHWDVEPTLPLELVDSVEAHRAITLEHGTPLRKADQDLWSLLVTRPGEVRR